MSSNTLTETSWRKQEKKSQRGYKSHGKKAAKLWFKLGLTYFVLHILSSLKLSRSTQKDIKKKKEEKREGKRRIKREEEKKER